MVIFLTHRRNRKGVAENELCAYVVIFLTHRRHRKGVAENELFAYVVSFFLTHRIREDRIHIGFGYMIFHLLF
jgi:hypothetical protein